MTADAETRAEVLAEVREVLAALKARAAESPRAVTYPETVSWDTPATPTPLADFAAVAKLMADPPPSVLQLLERLAYLLGLSDLEREFFEACASDEMMDAFDGRLAYADWLEERGDEEGTLRLRKVSPRPGDVLVIKMSAGTPGLDPLEEARGLMGQAAHVQQVLAARGVETSWVVLRPTASLSRVPGQDMVELGWVPAARVAEEREACAGLAENSWSDTPPEEIAAAIRARGGADPA